MTIGKTVIYENLGEIVNPQHTALVVWDVQNALVGGIYNKEEFLHNLKLFIRAARSNKIPIVYTKATPLPIDYESSWRLYWLMQRFKVNVPEKLPPFVRPGVSESETHFEIHNEVMPIEEDIVMHKHTPSIFIGTHFENMMRNRGIKTLLFTGISTEIGIASSARESANRGFYTIVVEDCVSSSNSQELHQLALRVLRAICLITPSRSIIGEWE
jgi:nicotinamidase-related amidase